MVETHHLFAPDNYHRLQACIHCGLCLASCPTYTVNGKEADSPRGRLALMKYIDREVEFDAKAAFRHIDLCLGCLACQTACPSGVQYGQLLETSRSYQRRQIKPLSRIQHLFLNWLTSHRSLGFITALLALLQRLALDRLARALRLLPHTLRFQLAGLPSITGKAFSQTHDNVFPALASEDQTQGTVALFTGCVMDHWFGEVHAATVRVLQWNGFNVLVPNGQTCCGALHAHAGLEEEAEDCLVRNGAAFQDIDAQALVVNAAGCGAQLRNSSGLDHNSLSVVDISEWLTDKLPRPPKNKLSKRVTYDAPCHLYHAQGIRDEPCRLLELACEHLLPLPETEMCCGSAGFYSLIHSDMSQDILKRKINHVQVLAPDMLVTGNPGCHLQLQAGLRASSLNIPVYHTIEVLDMAYRLDSAYRHAFGLDN
ncbi:MAG: 4Fe-4S dicluster domain-containing protein [Fidelibacterota bacterium]|nr:MAG: 4Fe-4S dicluster domain-containing protein [Candidatus Neomarinimicrobiota bacterium]